MLYWIGIAAGLLLFSPIVYSIIKRGQSNASPRAWFVVHVIASSTGAGLALIHTGGTLITPPGLLFVLLIAVIGLGLWIRLIQADRFAMRMGAQMPAFFAETTSDRSALADIIRHKTALLDRIDAGALETLFSPALRHWLTHPILTWKYANLARVETDLIGVRHAAGPSLAWSRRIHIALGLLFVVGLMIHFLVATLYPE